MKKIITIEFEASKFMGSQAVNKILQASTKILRGRGEIVNIRVEDCYVNTYEYPEYPINRTLPVNQTIPMAEPVIQFM